jgi:hypothetical protein
MATGSLPFREAFHPVAAGRAEPASATAWRVLQVAGSLKITVTMFLAAVFLLFVGTLAQDEKNLPEVKAEYFNSWVAKVPFSDFFPVTIFGESSLTGWFPFPGGATIGLVLLVNLIAAKITRFHVAAGGQRLVWGSVVSLLGLLLTLAVILGGHRADGLQGRPPFDYDVVWRLVQAGGGVLAVGLAAAAVAARAGLARWVAGLGAAVLAATTLATLVGGESWRMNEPGLRIMWQLIQSSVASLTLLAGLVMVFGARGGNVLIHFAVGLLMVGQFVFGDRQIEERMTIVEGRETNVACRTDEVELAVIDPSGTEQDRVTAISGRLLQARAGGEPIAIDGLPFTIRVAEWFPNSAVVQVGPVAPNPATAGLGKRWLATRRPSEGGASSQTNIASGYIQLLDTASGRDLGTHLVSQFLNDQRQVFAGAERDECDTVAIDGRDWRLQLRFRREYKPYFVRLDDVRRINYSASETPRDYSSYVTFTDPSTGAEQQGRIWMNNPVRYRGETFYQSTYSQIDLGGRPGEMTGLQVVENAGWLVPYVACVLAFWGMLVHFGGTFLRFADRREREAARDASADTLTGTGPRRNRRARRRVINAAAPFRKEFDPGDYLTPLAALTCVVGMAVTAARQPGGDAAAWTAAGHLPVLHEGRIKPLDTVARNTLQLLGNRASVVMPSGDDAKPGDPQGRVSATQWLLGVMAGSEWAARAPVFRIDAQEVVDRYDLTRRKGHRYSHAELEPQRAAAREQVAKLRELPREQQSFGQKKLLELEQKLMAYDLIRFAYEAPAMPTVEGDDEAARKSFLDQVMRMMQGARLIEENHPPAAIPPLGRPRRHHHRAALAGTSARACPGARGQDAGRPPRPAGIRGQPGARAIRRTARGGRPWSGGADPGRRRLPHRGGGAARVHRLGREGRRGGVVQRLQSHRPGQVALRPGDHALLRELPRLAGVARRVHLVAAGRHLRPAHLRARDAGLAHRPAAGGQPVFVGGVHRLGLRARRPAPGAAAPARDRHARGRARRRPHARRRLWPRLGRHDARPPSGARHPVLAHHPRDHRHARLRRDVPGGAPGHLLDRSRGVEPVAGNGRLAGREGSPGPPLPDELRCGLLCALLQLHRHRARRPLGR